MLGWMVFLIQNAETVWFEANLYSKSGVIKALNVNWKNPKSEDHLRNFGKKSMKELCAWLVVEMPEEKKTI